uniref:Uncharacterized protein n=1 Tax=Rangifer tarandus platyrhynchus TaxID=3082113 RepID=A0ACB0EE83_RANTA|nr:unnamed protein product [Rangifer tarandus platyrhynchus]
MMVRIIIRIAGVMLTTTITTIIVTHITITVTATTITAIISRSTIIITITTLTIITTTTISRSTIIITITTVTIITTTTISRSTIIITITTVTIITTTAVSMSTIIITITTVTIITTTAVSRSTIIITITTVTIITTTTITIITTTTISRSTIIITITTVTIFTTTAVSMSTIIITITTVTIITTTTISRSTIIITITTVTIFTTTAVSMSTIIITITTITSTCLCGHHRLRDAQGAASCFHVEKHNLASCEQGLGLVPGGACHPPQVRVGPRLPALHGCVASGLRGLSGRGVTTSPKEVVLRTVPGVTLDSLHCGPARRAAPTCLPRPHGPGLPRAVQRLRTRAPEGRGPTLAVRDKKTEAESGLEPGTSGRQWEAAPPSFYGKHMPSGDPSGHSATWQDEGHGATAIHLSLGVWTLALIGGGEARAVSCVNVYTEGKLDVVRQASPGGRATAGQDSETTTSLSNKTTTSQLHGTYCALRPLRLLTQVPSSAASPALFTLRAWRSAPPQRTGLSPTAWDLEPPTGPAGLRGLGEQRQRVRSNSCGPPVSTGLAPDRRLGQHAPSHALSCSGSPTSLLPQVPGFPGTPQTSGSAPMPPLPTCSQSIQAGLSSVPPMGPALPSPAAALVTRRPGKDAVAGSHLGRCGRASPEHSCQGSGAVLSEAFELRDEPQGPDYGPGLGLCQAPSEASIVMLLWKKIPPTKMSL